MSSLFSRRSIVWLAALGLVIASVTLVVVVTVGQNAGQSDGRDSPGGNGQDGGNLVVLGYVDLEHGVAPLNFVQPGRVTEILVAENEPVAKGQPLIKTDASLAAQAVGEAEAALSAAQARLAQAREFPEKQQRQIEQQQAAVDAMQAKVDAAAENVRLKEALRMLQQASEEEVAVAKAQVAEAKAGVRAEEVRLAGLKQQDNAAEIRQLQASEEQARAALEKAQINYQAHTLAAPSGGKCLRILVSVGEITSPAQPVLQFARDEPRVVRAEVEQAYAGDVSVGDEAEIIDETRPEMKWRGRVLYLSDWLARRRAILEETPNLSDARTVECVVSIDVPKNAVPPRLGQRVRVRIK